LASPTSLTQFRKNLFFYPNEKELLMFELHEGKLLKRLKIPGPNVATVRSRTGERLIQNRITALVWRGQIDGILSAHSDGQIRAWCPRTKDDEIADKEEQESWRGGDYDETENGKRKREVLDEVFKELTSKKITFG
jgi:DNA excision repair protein ERCC-8